MKTSNLKLKIYSLMRMVGFVLVFFLIFKYVPAMLAAAPKYQISGNIFLDQNADGVQNKSDSAFTNATLSLSGNGIKPITAKVNTDGTYSFSPSKPGLYTISITLFPSYHLTNSLSNKTLLLANAFPKATANFGATKAVINLMTFSTVAGTRNCTNPSVNQTVECTGNAMVITRDGQTVSWGPDCTANGGTCQTDGNDGNGNSCFSCASGGGQTACNGWGTPEACTAAPNECPSGYKCSNDCLLCIQNTATISPQTGLPDLSACSTSASCQSQNCSSTVPSSGVLVCCPANQVWGIGGAAACATCPSGHILTTSSGINTCVTTGGTTTGNTAIYILVFDDKNGDGQPGQGELGHGGIIVSLSGATPNQLTTQPDGTAFWTNVSPGTYIATITLPSGFTTPLNGRSITIVAGDTTKNVYFPLRGTGTATATPTATRTPTPTLPGGGGTATTAPTQPGGGTATAVPTSANGLPYCDTGTCNTCQGATANTCSANNGTQTCSYATFSGGGQCTPKTDNAVQCTMSNCTAGLTCSSNQCIAATTTPTPTNSIAATNFSVSIGLDGIGSVGDAKNSNSANSNKNPVSTKQLIITASDVSGNPIGYGFGNISYNSTTGLFSGTIPISQLPAGTYTIRVFAYGHLQKIAANNLVTQPGTTIVVPQTNLIAGDINIDNQLSILDYNMLISCSIFSQDNAAACNNSKTIADLNDDGVVNQLDYNLFLREFSVTRNGD